MKLCTNRSRQRVSEPNWPLPRQIPPMPTAKNCHIVESIGPSSPRSRGLMAGLQPHFLSRTKKSHDGFSRQLAQCEVSTNGAREGAEPRDMKKGSASRHSATQICRKMEHSNE